MARAARVHDRRNPGTDTENIGVHAESAETVHQMEMNIDQPRRDNETFDVNSCRPLRLEIGSIATNKAVADMNVLQSVHAACGSKAAPS
jgi:hypothetical protein